MRKYRFVDQGMQRSVIATVDQYMPVKEVVEQLVTYMKLPMADPNTAYPLLYLLAYKGRFLHADETLASAQIPEGETVDIIGRDIYLGSGFMPGQRHPREFEDYGQLQQLRELNPDIFSFEVTGWTIDRAPLSYRITLDNVAGPVADMARVTPKDGAPPLLDKKGEPVLAHKFIADIVILERYPFVEPAFFYVYDQSRPMEVPMLCHPQVHPASRKSCLFLKWRAIYNLVDCIERFVNQICYLGYDPAFFDRTGDEQPEADGVASIGPGWIHDLNPQALEWSRLYCAEKGGKFPFKQRGASGPPVLKRPDIAYGDDTVVDDPMDVDAEITIKRR